MRSLIYNDRRPEGLQITFNPPFVGQANRNKSQADDMIDLFGKGNPITKLDYVLCWYIVNAERKFTFIVTLQ